MTQDARRQKDLLSVLARSARSPRFSIRTIVLPAGSERIYDARDWVDAMVVVERGRLELEAVRGQVLVFEQGEVLFLDALPVRLLRNTTEGSVVLKAVTRRSRGNATSIEGSQIVEHD